MELVYGLCFWVEFREARKANMSFCHKNKIIFSLARTWDRMLHIIDPGDYCIYPTSPRKQDVTHKVTFLSRVLQVWIQFSFS